MYFIILLKLYQTAAFSFALIEFLTIFGRFSNSLDAGEKRDNGGGGGGGRGIACFDWAAGFGGAGFGGAGLFKFEFDFSNTEGNFVALDDANSASWFKLGEVINGFGSIIEIFIKINRTKN